LKKNNFSKKRKKKEKKGKVKKTKKTKKIERKNTVNYYCNIQCFVCGETMNPPHNLVYLLINTY
jgi:hypothetical protein